MIITNADLLLYAVTDRNWLAGRRLYDDVEKALKGGVTFVQLREKNLNEKDFLKEAMEIKELCHHYNVPFVINDNVDIALKSNADGVHIGQGDMSITNARKILGQDKIIGVSVQNAEQARTAIQAGADYLGAGAVFPTSSKDDAIEVDEKTLKEICSIQGAPVVAIGGITLDNMKQLKNSGISGIAVISAIFAQDDIFNAAKMLYKEAYADFYNKDR